MIKNFYYWLKCRIGFHNWINIDKNPLPSLGPGESILFCNEHECTHCHKKEMKGMGWLV